MPLYTESEFNSKKLSEKLPLKCEYCGRIFYATKSSINRVPKTNSIRNKFCSHKCSDKSRTLYRILKCLNCGIDTKVTNSNIKRSKTGKFFCNRSCAAYYNNAHKTKGCSRSKLEIWLEQQLKELYSD